MNISLAIFGFWVGLILLIFSYILRKNPVSKLLFQLAGAALFISIIIFLWWGILRAIA